MNILKNRGHLINLYFQYIHTGNTGRKDFISATINSSRNQMLLFMLSTHSESIKPNMKFSKLRHFTLSFRY